MGIREEQVEAARVKHGPHANTGILIYMNELAANTFTTTNKSYPVGAAVVKRKTIHEYLTKSGKLIRSSDNGVGGMIKRSSGYDPVHGDWEYFYFEDPKKIQSGRLQSCVKCHEGAKATDYVFGTWKSPETAYE